MYAMIGTVRFELLQSFTNLSETHAASFAKHDVLQGRPRLQAMGNDLTQVNFTAHLHWRLGNPDTAYRALVAACESQTAQAFVTGSGRFVGWFVIESVEAQTKLQDSSGRTAAREVKVSLIEFVGDPNNPLPTPGIGSNPLLSLLPESVVTTIGKVEQAVQTAVTAYNTAVSIAGQVQGIVTRVTQHTHNPSAVFGLLGDMMSSGTVILDNLGKLPGVADVLGKFPASVDFLRFSAEAAYRFDQAFDLVQTGLDSGSWGDWFDDVKRGLTDAADSLESASSAAQSLTAWLASREDSV